MMISCDECVRQHSEACRECVVTFLLGANDHGVELTSADVRAVRLLVGAGLVPRLRHAVA